MGRGRLTTLFIHLFFFRANLAAQGNEKSDIAVDLMLYGDCARTFYLT